MHKSYADDMIESCILKLSHNKTLDKSRRV